VLAALKAQHPEASKLRASLAFANEKARSGEHEAALKALDMIERLLASDGSVGVSVDPAAAFNARLAGLLPRVKTALADGASNAQDVKLKVSEAGVLARKRDFAGANQLLDEAQTLLRVAAAPKTDDAVEATPAVTSPGQSPSQQRGADVGAALAQWQGARVAALGQLKALQGKISAMQHPRGNSAIILLRSIQANLSARPDTRRSVEALERYLQEDDVIAEAEAPNGFGLKVELRKPLLAALSSLKQELAA
jgi:hypothetical protein